MESRLRRIEILLVLLFITVIAGIAVQVVYPNRSSSAETAQEVEQKDLPEGLSRDVLDRITYEVKINYNQENYDSLYQVFGELAKAQFSPEDIKREFEKLKKTVGKVETYAYSHYTYKGFNEGADWYTVFYKTRYTNGAGNIKITVRSTDTNWEIAGLRFNLEEI